MSDREARVHKVTDEELVAAGLKAPTVTKQRTRKTRPTGGIPKVGDEVKVVHCGNRAVLGSFGKVIKVKPLATKLAPDALLTVQVTLHIGEGENRFVRLVDVVCFATHVQVHRTLKEMIPGIERREEITTDGVERLMRQGMER